MLHRKLSQFSSRLPGIYPASRLKTVGATQVASCLRRASGLALEHGGVGLEDQFVEVFTLFRIPRQSQTGADVDLAVFPGNRQGNGLTDLLGNALDIASAMRTVEQQDKFVTAHARGDFKLADMGFDRRSGMDQDRIARLVAETVIDLLEVVQIDVAQRQLLAMPLGLEQLLAGEGNETIAIG